MKLAIIIDSSAGISQKEAAKRGWTLLPLILNVDNNEVHDGVDIDTISFYKNLRFEAAMRTSATPPALILEAYEKLSKSHDAVIVFGLSEKLSSQTSNLKVFAKDFTNVHVVTSASVGQYIVELCELAQVLAKSQLDIKQILTELNVRSTQQYAIVIPQTMDWLVKGGRVSAAAASLAKLFHIVPMIAFSQGQLDRYGKGKNFLETIDHAVTAVLAKCDPQAPVAIYHGANTQIDAIQKRVEAIVKKSVNVYYLPPAVAVHTGPGVIAIVSQLAQ